MKNKKEKIYSDFSNKEHCKILFSVRWKTVYDSVKAVNKMKKLLLATILLFIISCENRQSDSTESRESSAPAAVTTNYKRYTPNQFYNGDWGNAVQKCIDSACINGYPIYATGVYNCGTKILKFPKFFNEITWNNDRALIICGGITRDRPTTLAESQQQQNTKMQIYDLKIQGNGTGIGFEPGANSNSIFSNFQVSNFTTAGYFRTTQNGDIRNWSINDCVNGIMVDAETNNGLNPSQTQSNDTKRWFTRMHVSNGFNMNICFGTYHSFGCDIYYPETEGNAKVFRVFDTDNFGNNTVKMQVVVQPHFEFTQGFTTGGAMARVKLSSGVFKMIAPNHDVGALANMILVDASESGGATEIILEDVNKWEHTGIIFKGNQCRWRLDRGLSIISYSANNNPTVETNIKALFAAPVPKHNLENYNQNPKVWGYNTFDWTMF